MALTGYPQTHLSPDVEIVDSVGATKYSGPYSSLKVTGSSSTAYCDMTLYFDKDGYDTDSSAGEDYTNVRAMATDSIDGPIYGFKLTNESSSGNISVVAYKYSTAI